jgi:hypothetical protein
VLAAVKKAVVVVIAVLAVVDMVDMAAVAAVAVVAVSAGIAMAGSMMFLAEAGAALSYWDCHRELQRSTCLPL